MSAAIPPASAETGTAAPPASFSEWIQILGGLAAIFGVIIMIFGGTIHYTNRIRALEVQLDDMQRQLKEIDTKLDNIAAKKR